MNPPFAPTACAVVVALVLLPAPASGLDLFDLAPGSDRSEVEELLHDAGFRYRTTERSRIEVRASLLADVFELQRCVFDFGSDGRLDTASIEISPALDSDGVEILELYEEVKSLLLRRLGSPTRERSLGTVGSSAQILVGLASGGVERMMEWESEFFVRVGIPRRVDGRIVVVVAASRHSFPETDPFWGPR
jgi:hypothetical protein